MNELTRINVHEFPRPVTPQGGFSVFEEILAAAQGPIAFKNAGTYPPVRTNEAGVIMV